MVIRPLFCALIFAAVIGEAARASRYSLGPYPPGKNELYNRPVRLVLTTLAGERPSMERVRQLLETAHSFRYALTDPYRAALPNETDRLRSGDCKAKSLWLIEQMGDRRVRYVIGKIHRSSALHHAWVEWHDGEQWWILDPTNTVTPIAVESVGRSDYVSLYRYSPEQDWTGEDG